MNNSIRLPFMRLERSRLFLWTAIGAVITLALVVRIIGLGNESVWIDEAYSISLALHPIKQIIQGTAADQHPPFYYLLLHFWLGFSNSITFVRLLSALLGTLNVVQVIVIGWKLGKVTVGLGAAILLSISPFHIWYSQEARQYMLLAVLTTAASIELWNCLHGKHRWWLYILFDILAIYTQYFAVFIFIAHGLLVILWSYNKKAKRLFGRWIASMLIIGIAFAPWMPTAINQFLHHTMPWIGEPGAGDVRDVVLQLIAGNGIAILPSVLRSLALVAFLGIAAWVIYLYIRNKQRARWGAAFIGIWALLPFGLISMVAIFYPVFQMKQYLLILAPLIVITTGIVIASPRPWGMVLFTGLVLVNGVTTVYQQNTLTKDDWRGAVYYINAHQINGDIIFANPAASSLAIDLYWQNPLPFAGYPPDYDILSGGWAGQPLTPESVDLQMSTTTQGYARVWLLEFYPEFWDAHEYLSSWLAVHGTIIDNKNFGNIHLRLYELIH